MSGKVEIVAICT